MCKYEYEIIRICQIKLLYNWTSQPDFDLQPNQK